MVVTLDAGGGGGGKKPPKKPAPEAPQTASPRPEPEVEVQPQPVQAVSADTPARDASDEEIIAYISKTYGYLAWAMDIPEIRDTLIKAHREGWGELEVEAAVRATNWWKATEPNVREYIRLTTEDPAKLQSDIADVELALELEAARLGLDISAEKLLEIATTSVKFGWNEVEQRRALIQEWNYEPEVPLEGLIGDQNFDVRALAMKYLVPIGEETSQSWSRKILSGEATVAGYEQYLRDMAVGMFPALKTYIEQGITPSQFFEPYAQTATRLLERPFTSVDLFQNNVSNKLQMFDESKGTLRPITLTEFEEQIRGTPDWAKTNNAKETVAGLVNTISEMFGRV